MMAKSKFAGFLALGLLLAGCGSPKIDSSSDESFRESVQEVRDSLSDEERREFDDALRVLTMSRVNLAAIASGATTADALASDFRTSLSGKTAAELIAEAERVRREREAAEREQAIAEIGELIEKRRSSESARAELARFEVVRSRFFKQAGYIGEEPVIELTVRNGTDVAVSRAYFEGTLASPGRSVPWLKEDFNYGIAGGVEPGETVTWRLAPNRYSEWGRVDAPGDAIFTVVVVKLDGPDGETALSSREFTEADQRRLEQLQERFGVSEGS